MPETINKQKLAELQGVSLPTITKWINDGCPVEEQGGRGKGYQFDNSKVTEWRIAQARKGGRAVGEEESEAAAKRRKMSAEADIAEMKAAETAGELVRAEEVVIAVQKDLAKVKARMLAIPSRLAPLLVNQSEVEAKEMMEREVHSALAELSYVEPEEEDVLEERISLQDKEFAKKGLQIGQFSCRMLYDVEYRCVSTDFSGMSIS